MKRAVAAAGVLGTLILVVALGVGYLAGHGRARTGASTVSHSAAQSLPPAATLDSSTIYGDGTSVPAIYGDGGGVPVPVPGTTSTTGDTITVTPGDGIGTASTGIYGD